MSWTYKSQKIGDISQFPANTYGFVYIVTHKPSGKAYIGKKVLYFTKKVKIGKKELDKLEGVVGRRPAYNHAIFHIKFFVMILQGYRLLYLYL